MTRSTAREIAAHLALSLIHIYPEQIYTQLMSVLYGG